MLVGAPGGADDIDDVELFGDPKKFKINKEIILMLNLNVWISTMR